MFFQTYKPSSKKKIPKELLKAIDQGNLAAVKASSKKEEFKEFCKDGALLNRAIKNKKFGVAKFLIPHTKRLISSQEMGDNTLHLLAMDQGSSMQEANEVAQAIFDEIALRGESLIHDYNDPVNERDMTVGIAPLSLAICFNDEFLTKLLLTNGADANQLVTDTEEHPLVTAAAHDSRKVVKLLLKHGAWLEATDRYRRTPLHMAVSYCQLENVRYLLNKKASLQNQAFEGGTMLHVLLEENRYRSAEKQQFQIEIATLLLEAGINIDSTNRKGLTALRLATDSKNQAIVDFLLSRGANPHVEVAVEETSDDESSSSESEKSAEKGESAAEKRSREASSEEDSFQPRRSRRLAEKAREAESPATLQLA